MSEAPNRDILFLRGKLNALSAVIRLGHESFTRTELADWAAHVVNNSVLALPYNRAALADLRSGTARVIAVSGAPQVNSTSEYVIEVQRLFQSCRRVEAITALTPEKMTELGIDRNGMEAREYLAASAKAIFLVPLRPTGLPPEEPTPFFYLVEFDDGESASIAPAMLALLRESYQESLAHVLNRRRLPLVRRVIDRRKWFRPSRVLLYLLVLFVLASVLVRVPQTVSAEFSVVPETELISYAPFEGVIAECRFRSGDRVKQGEEVVVFDTEERTFNLNAARNEFAHVSAQLELIARQSFSDPAKRGQVRLLELQKEKAAIEIARNQWYLEQSVIRAAADGVIDLGEEEKLEGRAVRPGERLFELLGDGKLVAEIELDERNASVLREDCTLALYLHTRPESPLPGRLISISPKPVLTAKRTYCYVLRAELSDPASTELFYGMRGIARVAGPRVSLGYYLFRHLVLWFRQL